MPPEIQGRRRLRPDEIVFEGEISEIFEVLNFCLACWFNVDDVFGTHVETTENGDWINVYADYDMREHHVMDTLEIILHRDDGSDTELSYRLDENEKAALLRKMKPYCVEQTGQTLSSLCVQLLEQDNAGDIPFHDRAGPARPCGNCSVTQFVPVAQISRWYLVTVVRGLSLLHGALCVCLSKQSHEIGG